MRDRNTASVSVRTRLRYHFDNLLTRGTWAVLLYLGVMTFVTLVVSAILLTLAGVTFAGSEGSSYAEDFWQSMLRAIDPGTMVADVAWGTRLLSLLVTIFGILVAGTLIGLIAAGVEQRVEEMQRGRSMVVESGHIVILGASNRLPVMVNQLTLAGGDRRAGAIVVLADREPKELSDDVRSFVTDTRGKRIVFRWGDPTRRSDLRMVRIDKARTIIVLAAEDAEGDAGVVKATLAVGAELGGFDRVTTVVELTDPNAAVSLAEACGGQIHHFVPLQAIARITAMTLGEPGLHQVVEELLDFRGADIYVRPIGHLSGSSFGEAVRCFAKARAIGRMRPDGTVELNPSANTVLAHDDRLIVIADDDEETLALRGSLPDRPMPTAGSAPLAADRRHERLLIVGWSALGAEFVHYLNQVVAPGSSVEVIYDSRLFEADEILLASTDELPIKVTASRADIWQPNDELLSDITSVVFLGYRRDTSPERADSRTLLNVMLLRRALEQRLEPPRIVAELVNADNVDLAKMTGADDFLVSDAIASRFIAQLADQPERRPVLLTLYGPEGPSVHLAEAATLGIAGERSWEEIVDTVYTGGLIAIGWRRASSSGGELALNPHCSERIALDDDDLIVVIG